MFCKVVTHCQICLLPLDISGNGPAMSVVTIINVLVGPKGINFGLQFVLGVFTFWSTKHLTNFFTSLLKLVQKNRDLIFSIVLSVPECSAIYSVVLALLDWFHSLA